MADMETIDMLIEGGNAKPGPTTAPKLGMFKVNMGQLFDEINKETADYKGMSVPVKVLVNKKDGSYKFTVGTPPVASLLAKELGMKKIAVKQTSEGNDEEEPEEKPKKKKKETEEEVDEEGKKKLTKKDKQVAKKKEEKKKVEREIVADVKMEQIVKVARMKRPGMLSKTFKASVKEVVGSCVSMPVVVEGKSPKEVLVEIDEGKYDDLIKE
jgi:large subunit ribosomal protein L11